MNYVIVGECIPINVATFKCGDKSRVVGEEKPADGISWDRRQVSRSIFAQ